MSNGNEYKDLKALGSSSWRTEEVSDEKKLKRIKFQSFFTGRFYWGADTEAGLERSCWSMEQLTLESSLSHLVLVFTRPLQGTFFLHISWVVTTLSSCPRCHVASILHIIFWPLFFPPSTVCPSHLPSLSISTDKRHPSTLHITSHGSNQSGLWQTN